MSNQSSSQDNFSSIFPQPTEIDNRVRGFIRQSSFVETLFPMRRVNGYNQAIPVMPIYDVGQREPIGTMYGIPPQLRAWRQRREADVIDYVARMTISPKGYLVPTTPKEQPRQLLIDFSPQE